MKTFVLVHGTWSGGWMWRTVAERLRAEGHTVYTPTLTGLGEREHLVSRQTNLDTHIQDIAGVIACEQLDDVVLVGTSYAGLVISGVADRITDKIDALIYLNAALPANGKCMLDTVSAERRATVQRLADEQGDGYRIPSSLVLDTGIENEQARDAFLARMSPHPLPSLLQPISLTGRYTQVPRKAYVLATKKVSHHFQEYYDWAAKQQGWTAHTIASHHYPMATMPEATAALLMEIADS
ncbi:alpha/beta fold hydrolase [Rhodoplanes sp. Z2-YC6860]|uniref:alpha/beta fold hydrolase n=1 Tax=Rhodoplanes sp. Z2-YC6860 TaxID=674703 RepID=UPI00078E1734|nr:alpha/beta hydrolase [Rhodoplanes sp. Z2-YC6860]AMN43044.1 esterase [Rhodoplanes sp. Z2-YC6860]